MGAWRQQLSGVAMVHVRIVAPANLAGPTLELLERSQSVINIVHLPRAAMRPDGDVVSCDVAREDVSAILSELRELGLEERGSIALDTVDTSISAAAQAAERHAAGSPADAVVWEEVETRTSESAELSGSFLAFMMLATVIAAIGILTDSIILIIGAMVVGPEFGPLAGLCVALVQRRADLARRSALALAVGFTLGIAAAFVTTLLLRAAGRGPDELNAASHPATLFISNPNIYSVLVALAAGVAGMLSLTTAKSGALVGVLISVTTIPAAANIGVAAAYAHWDEFAGASAQLIINVLCLVAAGVLTLAVQRALFERRRARMMREACPVSER